MPPRRHSRRKMRVLSDHNAENNKVNRQCAATEGYVRLLLTKKHPTIHPKVRKGGVKNPSWTSPATICTKHCRISQAAAHLAPPLVSPQPLIDHSSAGHAHSAVHFLFFCSARAFLASTQPLAFHVPPAPPCRHAPVCGGHAVCGTNNATGFGRTPACGNHAEKKFWERGKERERRGITGCWD